MAQIGFGGEIMQDKGGKEKKERDPENPQ